MSDNPPAGRRPLSPQAAFPTVDSAMLSGARLAESGREAVQTVALAVVRRIRARSLGPADDLGARRRSPFRRISRVSSCLPGRPLRCPTFAYGEIISFARWPSGQPLPAEGTVLTVPAPIRRWIFSQPRLLANGKSIVRIPKFAQAARPGASARSTFVPQRTAGRGGYRRPTRPGNRRTCPGLVRHDGSSGADTAPHRPRTPDIFSGGGQPTAPGRDSGTLAAAGA